jgi:hypothetical protein
MKKAFTVIAVAFVAATFVACGSSAEDKAREEERAKQIQDSISNSITESMQTEADTTMAPAMTDESQATPAEEGHEGHNH